MVAQETCAHGTRILQAKTLTRQGRNQIGSTPSMGPLPLVAQQTCAHAAHILRPKTLTRQGRSQMGRRPPLGPLPLVAQETCAHAAYILRPKTLTRRSLRPSGCMILETVRGWIWGRPPCVPPEYRGELIKNRLALFRQLAFFRQIPPCTQGGLRGVPPFVFQRSNRETLQCTTAVQNLTHLRQVRKAKVT